MPICAYCKNEGVLTREHVIPAFAYAFQKGIESNVVGWNEVVEKMVAGEHKVRDVCAACNNGVLSKLDAYGKETLVEAGILTPSFSKLGVSMRYDHGLLSRWLLKISFNSSRTDGAHRHLFERFVPFILGEAKAPPRSQLVLLAFLAAPTVPSPEQISKEPYASAIGRSNRFNPFLVRICYGIFQPADNYTPRLVILGPLVFYMLVFGEGASAGQAAVAVRRFLKDCPAAVELSPNRQFVEIRTGQQTWIDLHAFQVARIDALDAQRDG
jgi:hypothetical protein